MRINRDALVAGGVAGAAFIASAQHIWHVTVEAGNPGLIAALHPAAIDGLIYIGIRSIQRGQRRSGVFAVAYGAGYSLAFNGASYGGFRMHWIAMAACLPIALVAAVLIVHGRKHEVPAVVAEVVREVIKYPELLPIVPFVPPVKPAKVDRAKPVSGGPAVQYDMDKVVDMLLRAEDVSGLVSDKVAQRVRRVLNGLAEGRVPSDLVRGDVSARFVTNVSSAREKAMSA